MLMRHSWLHLACMVSICGWLPSWFGWIWIGLCGLWFYKRIKFWTVLAVFILVIFQLRLYPSIPSLPENTQILEVMDIKSSYVIAQNETHKVILYNVENVGFHDVVEVKGESSLLYNTKNFNLFDFSSWAARRGIYYSIDVKQINVMKQGNRLRSHLYRYIQSMDENVKAWLSMTLFGIQSDEKQDVSYLINSSGMHLSYLSHLIQVVLTLWMSTSIAQGITLCFIIFVASITVLKEACLRILFFRGATYVFPNASVHDRLGIAMVSLLLLFPYMAQELSYVLPVMFRLIFLFSQRKTKQKIISMAILIPIQFSYFNKIDGVSLVLFSFLRKLYGIAYGCALLYLLLPITLLYQIAQGMLTIGSHLSSISLPFYYHASMLFVCIWYYYLFHYISHHPKKSGYVLLGMLVYTQVSPYLRPYMEVMMIDVGQGDCTLISLPFNQGNILLDVAGSPYKNIPKDIIVPALQARGITALDAVIITHDDYDHSGGLSQLQELMKVEQVIQTKQESLMIGKQTFFFLENDKLYEDVNDNSILTFFEAYDLKFLFMGDAGREVEKQILQDYPKLTADILKVGHHGSKTSSDVNFLHQLQPTLALISCGYQNRYGHPSKEVLMTLQKENIYPLITPENGAVSIKLTNFVRFYNTATHEFGIIE